MEDIKIVRSIQDIGLVYETGMIHVGTPIGPIVDSLSGGSAAEIARECVAYRAR
jgi:hypothetical protein